jgi:ankyrin repeat protein
MDLAPGERRSDLVGSALILCAETGENTSHLHEGNLDAGSEVGHDNLCENASSASTTPLWWATVGGHEAVVRLLLEHGAFR